MFLDSAFKKADNIPNIYSNYNCNFNFGSYIIILE